jgi:uncharacterized protein YraI
MKQWGPAILLATACAVAALPGYAQAQGQSAVTTASLNLRAGPARDYPAVINLPAGHKVVVQSCLADYTWCDVASGTSHGWVYAGNLNTLYKDKYVPVLKNGAAAGIAVSAFVLGDYWSQHYTGRSWYKDRDYWANRPAPLPNSPYAGRPGSTASGPVSSGGAVVAHPPRSNPTYTKPPAGQVNAPDVAASQPAQPLPRGEQQFRDNTSRGAGANSQ